MIIHLLICFFLSTQISQLRVLFHSISKYSNSRHRLSSNTEQWHFKLRPVPETSLDIKHSIYFPQFIIQSNSNEMPKQTHQILEFFQSMRFVASQIQWNYSINLITVAIDTSATPNNILNLTFISNYMWWTWLKWQYPLYKIHFHSFANALVEMRFSLKNLVNTL